MSEKRWKPGARHPKYWTLARREGGRDEVLIVEVYGGVKTLPLFGLEDEAALFLHFENPGAGWRTRRVDRGEILRILFGPPSLARRVLLDPLPAALGEHTNLLVSLGREEFAQKLYAERGAASPGRPRLRRCLRILPSGRRTRGGRGDRA